MKAAAVLAWITGLGFGLLCPYAIWYLADRGEVWTFLGFPTYGEGPFEDIGIARTVLVLLGWSSLRRRRARPAGGPTHSPPAMNQRQPG